MSNTRRGLPITSSRIEKIFPKLTPVQISRITSHGRLRAVQSGEVLIEQGDSIGTILSGNHGRSRDSTTVRSP